MLLTPKSYRRGDLLEHLDGHLIGAIGAFSKTCVAGKELKEPLEVILLEGDRERGFQARLGDAHHQVYEGKLFHATVSFTLEAFSLNRPGEPLKMLKKDSACLVTSVEKELRDHVLNITEREKIKGGLLYVQGLAKALHVYAHTNSEVLNDETKTFDHREGPLRIEGWGNFSLIDGEKPFVHVHGIYFTPEGKKFGGHFIMDEKTILPVEKAELLIYPVSSLIRTLQGESFPTWKI